MPNDAISALENALAAGGGRGVIGELGYVYALVDRTQDALRQMELLETLSNEGRDSAFGRALIYYGLGEIDATLEWLQEAYDERDFRMILLAVDPLWDELRKDPRFQRLLLTIGLTADVQA